MAINNDRKQIIKSFKIYINTYLLHICVVLNYIYEDKDRIVTKEDISEAIKYLESGKSDGDAKRTNVKTCIFPSLNEL